MFHGRFTIQRCVLVPVCFLAVILFFAGSAGAAPPDAPRYVFLFIGDGMGSVQREAAQLTAEHLGLDPLTMEQFPVRGSIITGDASGGVTDSAAAGTALAAGVKTDNGKLGITPDGESVEPMSTTLHRAVGMKTGLLTSVQLNHATPAAFYAHVDSRNDYDTIARQFAHSPVDLLLGNGINGNERDEVVQEWQQSGVEVVRSLDAAAAVPTDRRLVVILDFPVATQEKADPTAGPGALARAVDLAIQRLDGPNGFFIMVESCKIDWSGHANDAGAVIDETLAFDRAVARAEAFYREHPEQTLIVVTADHETGGMRVDPDRFDAGRILHLTEAQTQLQRQLPGDTELELAAVESAIGSVLGIEDLTSQEQAELQQALKAGKNVKRSVVRAAMKIAQQRAGVTWSTGGHTGADVPVTAIGVGADHFAGRYDNTQIPARIIELVTAPVPASSTD